MYPRYRILRKTETIRLLVAESFIKPQQLIAPLFVIEGSGLKEPINTMPGYYRMSIDLLLEEVVALTQLKINTVLLFAKCLDHLKDNTGQEAWNAEGLMQRSIRAIKKQFPALTVMTDVALDPYSIYGHDGIVENNTIINDRTVEALAQMSLSHARAGADFVAPSDMMDGRVGVIRQTLEKHGFHETGIMSYSAKYASCFYGPFRDALDSSPQFGDKKTYQMDIANARESIKESLADENEGADILVIKPALTSLDIIHQVKQTVHIPVAAYQVSGEYAMIMAAVQKGLLKEESAIVESARVIKRAGADIIITYFAKKLGTLLSEQ
ncbi:MAG: porphobilinogen synthase [Phycisphaerales bacterium]|nr:porphobilinogen synthase [Phycisphaerales bacterium]